MIDKNKEMARKQGKYINDLTERANNGEPLAKMRLAEPCSLAYWQAYQQYEIEQATNYNTNNIRLVNEISVYDDGFAEKVIASIETEGKIYGRLISSKRM